MNINDIAPGSKGRITYAEVCKKTGKQVGFLKTLDNVVTYNAADILAQLLSGNVNYIPSKIGFIYAPSGAPLTDPGSDRDQSWSVISQDVQSSVGNIILSNLGSQPIIAEDGPAGRYEGNAVTLNAVSDRDADLVFSGGSYAALGPQAGSDKYFQVVLLAAVFGPGQAVPTYVPYARAALGTGIDVSADTELAVFWTQTFK